jgi:hypothetical protein
MYLQPQKMLAKRTTGLGGTQPSCFAFISSSGPVLVPIQLDQSGDKNLCDNNQKIIVAPYDINQSSITIKKIVIAILIYRVTLSKSLSMISR